MSSAEDVYQNFPLDSRRDDIRLLTISDSPSPSDLVQCRLETASLQDISHQYAAHLASPGVVGKPKRKQISLWGARHGVEGGSDRMGNTPPASFHRFSWGDFAALSYV